MGRFNDLPKDVLWLVFRLVIQSFTSEITRMPFYPPSFYDSGSPFLFYGHTTFCKKISSLSLVSKQCFNVIKSKTKRVNHNSFLFIKNFFA